MNASHIASAARLLIVDDEDTIRLVLGRYLQSRGFEVELAPTGDAALEALSKGRFDLMLCDVRMPGFSGVEIVPAALELDADLGIVMLSAVSDAATATEALAMGALDYLTKPIELAQLYEAVERAMEKRLLRNERQRAERSVPAQVDARTQELGREKGLLQEVAVRVVESLVTAMEAKNDLQRGHSARVGDLAASMGDFMKLTPDVVEDIRVAGRLRDVGYVGVRESVLAKPGPLSPVEFEHVKTHVRIGVEILAPLSHLERSIMFVAEHHERWDGHGYPEGRAGEAISMGGRILTAADVFSALTASRAHRGPMEQQRALDFLAGQVGSLLDTRAYEALRGVVRRH